MTMNLHSSAMSNSIVTQQTSSYYIPQSTYPSQVQWLNVNAYGTCQLPFSQYCNVFSDIPSTKTSWTFPNGCVTSNIVRFTTSPTPTYPNGSLQQLDQYRAMGTIPVKRKSLIPEDEVKSSKIFITEEKMAAGMSCMHISNDFVNHNNNNPETLNESEMEDVLAETTENGFNPKLIVCDELRDLHTKMNSLIPESLLPLEKSSTALVIWNPTRLVNLPEDDKSPTKSSVVITDITDRPDLNDENISEADFNSIIRPSVEYPSDAAECMEL